MPALSAAERARARARAYGLLSALLADGLGPASLDELAALPGVAETLPARDALEPDEAAADHQALLGFDVLPFEAVFRAEDTLLDGPVTEAVARAYGAAGFRPATDAPSPDHVAEELAFLAALAGAELAARRGGDAARAGALAGMQAGFLSDHLLRWLLPLLEAVSFAETALPATAPYRAGLEVALALAVDQVAASAQAAAPRDTPPEAFDATDAGQDATALLDDPRTSLRDIATHLTTPCKAGLFVGRGAVTALARGRRLPRGFGDRRQMLVNLLRAAAQHERVPALAADLAARCEDAARSYEEAAAEAPALSTFAASWAARARASGALARAMGTRAAELVEREALREGLDRDEGVTV